MKLPPVSGEEVLKILLRDGYLIQSRKGSHITLKSHNEPYHRITIPLHDTLKKGTLLNILGQVNMSKEELYRKMR
jgi:predicted RNA binding protein YcfA (HicA-like mRNA interferase family)